jgi:hypothetical protein
MNSIRTPRLSVSVCRIPRSIFRAACVPLKILVFINILAQSPFSTPAQTAFTQVTTGDIVNDLGVYTRPVWADFNNDGWLDLFVSGFLDRTNVFYLNNGDGTFTKRTQGNPVLDVDFHSGCAAGDYDNDGQLDLLVSAGVIASNPR